MKSSKYLKPWAYGLQSTVMTVVRRKWRRKSRQNNDFALNLMIDSSLSSDDEHICSQWNLFETFRYNIMELMLKFKINS